MFTSESRAVTRISGDTTLVRYAVTGWQASLPDHDTVKPVLIAAANRARYRQGRALPSGPDSSAEWENPIPHLLADSNALTNPLVI